jgi:hypothetical protein
MRRHRGIVRFESNYRFDIDAGQALGRDVARFAIAADASGSSVLTPR